MRKEKKLHCHNNFLWDGHICKKNDGNKEVKIAFKSKHEELSKQ